MFVGQIVSFFFEYLQLEKYARLKDIFFCGGSLSFLLLHGGVLVQLRLCSLHNSI